MLRFLFCIRDEHETLVATLDMWKFRVVTTVVGRSHFVIASTLVGSTDILSFDTTCPRKETCRNQNLHLENLAYNLCSLKVVRTFRRCSSCSRLVLEYMRMSSMNTITNMSRHSLNTRFINSINIARALVRPNDITTNSSDRILS